MDLEMAFGIASQGAMLGWLALAVVPYRFAVGRYVAVAVALALGALYAALIGAFWSEGQGGFGSLAGVAALFAHKGLLLGGWVHYLAFDLLVGTWEREEAAALGIHRLLLLPCLFLTFMFGPIGWLLFMAVRFARKTMLARAETAAA